MFSYGVKRDYYRLTNKILDVSNAFQNKMFSVYERVFVSPRTYYLDYFEIYYLNGPLNWYGDPFCFKWMNLIQVKKTEKQEWNRLLDEVITIIKYKKITIDHAIYIKFFSDGTLSYLTVSTDDVLNNTNNETSFPELRIF